VQVERALRSGISTASACSRSRAPRWRAHSEADGGVAADDDAATDLRETPPQLGTLSTGGPHAGAPYHISPWLSSAVDAAAGPTSAIHGGEAVPVGTQFRGYRISALPGAHVPAGEGRDRLCRAASLRDLRKRGRRHARRLLVVRSRRLVAVGGDARIQAKRGARRPRRPTGRCSARSHRKRQLASVFGRMGHGRR
jgi:hypothetical protein